MQFICEIVPSSFLTPLRRTLAQELSNLGYIQTEIATILGVSQPVISTYLRAQIPQESSLINRPEFKELTSKLISLIINEKLTSFELMETICLECQKLRTAGPLCDIHRKNCGYNFSPDCNICFPSAEQSTIFDQKLQLIKELFDAAQQLVSYEERFGRLIPEIGCQFVSILDDSETPTDIAGFPGRIITVKGKGRVVAPPEFGQGATLAKILLFFQKEGSSHNALISLRKTDDILTMISSDKNVTMTTEGDKNWEQTLQQLPKSEIQKIDVIADSGGVGLEPILYLFGKSPTEIAEYLISKF